MFQNYSANAGIILGGGSSSIIDSELQWDFNNVIVLNYDPSDNRNDRPRINFWRSDQNYLVYMSGGLNVLTPAPTGVLTQPWGDRRTGSFNLTMPISPEGGIDGGIDLFTHDYAPPSFLFPPLNSGWTITTDPNVPNEIKYQYKFKRGETNPNVIIILNYSGCPDPFIPTCPSGQFLSYTRVSDCPSFECYNPLANSIGYSLIRFYQSAEYPNTGSIPGPYNLGLGLANNYNNSWNAYGGKANFLRIFKDGELLPENSSNTTQRSYVIYDPLFADRATWYGYSLDMNQDGSVLVVGAPKLGASGKTEMGMVHVYTGIGGNGRPYNGNDSTYRLKNVFDGDGGNGDSNLDNFGSSVKITKAGNIIFCAAYGDTNDKGSIFIYTGDKNIGWKLRQKLSASGFTNIDNARQGQYGNIDCSDDGSVLVVGAPSWSFNNSGKLIIYTGNLTNGWNYKDSFTSSVNTTGSQYSRNFGYAVSCNKNASVIAVGEPGISYSGLNSNGLVHIYTGSQDSSWEQKQVIPGLYDAFARAGESVKLNKEGNTLYFYSRGRLSNLTGISNIVSGYDLNDGIFIYTGNAFEGFRYKEYIYSRIANTEPNKFGYKIGPSEDGTFVNITVPYSNSSYIPFPNDLQAGGLWAYESIPSERGFLYSTPGNIWQNGVGLSTVGQWFLSNNGGSQTLIRESTVDSTRSGIGDPAFFFYPGTSLFNNYSNGYFVFNDDLVKNEIEIDANFGLMAFTAGGVNGIEFWSGTNQGSQIFRLQYGGINGAGSQGLYFWSGSTFNERLFTRVINKNIKINLTINTGAASVLYLNVRLSTPDDLGRTLYQSGIFPFGTPVKIKQINFYAGGVSNLNPDAQPFYSLGVNNITLKRPGFF